MDTIDFTQTGGFPLDQNILGFMQAQSQLAQQPANLGGQRCILSGCVIVGASVGNGFVAINGEILPFNGGVIAPKVIIVETATNLTYEDGGVKPVQKIRYATFGDDGVQNHLWANFKRNTSEGVLARLERLERVAAPFLASGKGGMVLWNRAANLIPTGWQEVVDWRGRLPVGVNPDDIDFNVVGETGGSKTFTLNSSQTPRPAGLGSNFQSGGRPNFENGPIVHWPTTISSAVAATQDVKAPSPYRTVYFIEYIGN